MIGTHIRVLVGLALSRGQRLRSLVVLLGSGTLLSLSPSLYRSPEWTIQAVMLLLTAVLLVQWRASFFEPAGTKLELPIPLSRPIVEWVTSLLQVGVVGVMSLILRICWVFGVGQDLAETQAALTDHILFDVLLDTALLVPTLMLVGRLMQGAGGGQREILIWAAGPALAAISVMCMALGLPEPVVYALWLGMFVALIITVVLVIGRLVGWLRTWRQHSKSETMLLSRQGQDARVRLGTDGRSGIVRAICWLMASDVLGWCLLWFAFSSWMFHEVGLDAQQAQNYVTPLGLALLLGVRILALGSLMGQVGLLGSFQPWPRQPWLLLPLPRTTIQRALLRHIGIVALVAIGLNIAFLSAWAGATEALMWSPQHVQLRGLISSMVQSMAILTAIMAMAFMVVGTGLRGIIQLTCVAAGAVLSVLVYVDNIPVPGAAASYVPTAVANSVAVAVLMAAVWAVSWHRAGKPA